MRKKLGIYVLILVMVLNIIPVRATPSSSGLNIYDVYVQKLNKYEKIINEIDKGINYPEQALQIGYMVNYRATAIYLKYLKGKFGENIDLSTADVNFYMKKSDMFANRLLFEGDTPNLEYILKFSGKSLEDFTAVSLERALDKLPTYIDRATMTSKTLGLDDNCTELQLQVNAYFYPTRLFTSNQVGDYKNRYVFSSLYSLLRGAFASIEAKVAEEKAGGEEISTLDAVNRYTPYIDMYDSTMELINSINETQSKFNFTEKVSKPAVPANFITAYNKYRKNTSINGNIVDVEAYLRDSKNSVKDRAQLNKLIDFENPNALMRAQYVYMLASTSIYEPLKSSNGNKEYMTLLGDINPELSKLYDEFGIKRKPLLQVNSNNPQGILKNEIHNFDTQFVNLRQIRDYVLNDEKHCFIVARTEYSATGELVTSPESPTPPVVEDGGTVPPAEGSGTEVPEEGEEATPEVLVDDSGREGAVLVPPTTPTTPETNPDTPPVEDPSNPVDPDAPEGIGTVEEQLRIQDEFLADNIKDKYSNIIFSTGYWNDDHLIENSGTDYKFRSFNLLNMLLFNILQGESIKQDLLDSPLYMDFLGNIVLQDNTILVPAIANYALYGATVSNGNSVGGIADSVQHLILNKAFLSTYPALSDSKDLSSMLSNGEDEKYMLKAERIDSLRGSPYKTSKGKDLGIVNAVVKGVKGIWNFIDNLWSGDEKTGDVGDSFKVGVIQRYGAPSSKSNETDDNADARDLFGNKNGLLTLSNNVIDFNGRKYSFSSMNSPETNRFLAESNYYYLSCNSEQEDTFTLNSNHISPAYIIRNVIVPVFYGFEDTGYYYKNLIKSENINGDEFSKFVTMFGKLTNNIYDRVKNTKGIIGFRDVFQNRILGSVVMFGFDYGVIIVIIIFVIFILKYIREEYPLGSAVVMATLISFIVFWGTTVIPRYIPDIYNLVSNNFAHDIAVNSILFEAEKRYYPEKIFTSEYEKAEDVKMDYSLTLFKYDDAKFDFLKTVYDINRSDSSKPITLNGTEVYVLADQLRVPLSNVWGSSSIKGSYDEFGKYSLKILKPDNTVFDNYMPYTFIMNNFVSTLNDYTETTSPERRTYRYGDIIKDAFICNSFTTSGLFVGYTQVDKLYEKSIKEKFHGEQIYPMVDFLRLTEGLNRIAEVDSLKAKEGKTLWYKNVEELIRSDNEAVSANIKAINDNVKLFMFNNKRTLSRVSDENFIKIVSLYASMEFNAKFSKMDKWLYPTNLNYGEITLNNIFQVTLPTEQGIFARDTLDIVHYVMTSSNLGGVVLLLLDLVLQSINGVIMSWFYSVMYIMFLGLLVLKITKKNNPSPLLKGFTRASVILLLIYYCNVIFYSYIPRLDSTIMKLGLIFVFNFVVLDNLLVIFNSIRMNVFDLGYGTLKGSYSAQTSRVKRMVNRGRINNYKDTDENNLNNKDNPYSSYSYESLDSGKHYYNK